MPVCWPEIDAHRVRTRATRGGLDVFVERTPDGPPELLRVRVARPPSSETTPTIAGACMSRSDPQGRCFGRC